MLSNFFNYEQPIMELLQAIPNVNVVSSVDDAAVENLSMVKPTLVIHWSSDAVTQANEDAALVERELDVYILFAGATPDRQAEDGEVAGYVFDALHGVTIPGYEPLFYTGGESNYDNGVREYRLSFKTKTVLRPSTLRD